MSKKDVDKLYQLILLEDEVLMGSQWDEMYCNEYDTPKSIIETMLRIYIETDFVEVDEDLVERPLVENHDEKILAMIKYFEKLIEDMREEVFKS